MQHKKKKIILICTISVLILGGGLISFIYNFRHKLSNTDESSYNIELISTIASNGQSFKTFSSKSILYTLDLNINEGNSLNIYNISEKDNPIHLGSYITTNLLCRFSIQDNFAYLTTYNAGLEIVNISDYSNIERVGWYQDSPTIYGIQVRGDFAYLASFDNGFEILNISDPTDPVLITAKLETERCAFIVLHEDLCFITSQYNKINVFNISNQISPILLDDLRLNNRIIWDPCYYDGYILAADHDSEDTILILDVSNPQSIHLVQMYIPEGRVNRVMAADQKLYLASINEGLVVLDFQDINNISEVTRIENIGVGNDIYVENGFVFYAGHSNGLSILKIINALNS